MNTFCIRLPIPPESYAPLPDFFYNHPAYVAFHHVGTVVSFLLQPEDSEAVIARVHFSCNDETARSHWRAPFGFLETNVTNQKALQSFWENVELKLKEMGVRKITLVSWPEIYSPNSRSLWMFFERLGFTKKFEDANFHLPIHATPILAHFLKPERKRLRKCLREGLLVKIESAKEGWQVHQKLKEFRDQKQIPLNITAEALASSFLRFPDRYVVFKIEKEGQIIALSVCLRVNDAIFYHFCLACDIRFNSLSPSVLLYASIYEYCQKEGYQWLDFGIASTEGRKQEGLFQFKRNLGGQLSAKPTFSKNLS